jgi:hypothetical protein
MHTLRIQLRYAEFSKTGEASEVLGGSEGFVGF